MVKKEWGTLSKRKYKFEFNKFQFVEQLGKYIFSFYIEGVIGIIKRWLEDDCNDEIDFIIGIIERNTFVNEGNN